MKTSLVGPSSSRSRVSRRAQQVLQQLQQDVAHRARAADLGAHGHQRARESAGEVEAVLGAHLVGFDEVPPRHLLPTVRTGARRTSSAGPPAVWRRTAASISGMPKLAVASATMASLNSLRLRGKRATSTGSVWPMRAIWNCDRLHQVVVHAVDIPGVRDALHRVRDVFVEAREEAEPVLSREIGASIRAGAWDAHAARLASRDVHRFEHAH
jgi:hypothetical protein